MDNRLAEIEGYVAESAYPSSYHETFSPAWTDHCLLRCGLEPPRHGDDRVARSFTMLDLGCGDGLGLLLLAATHPRSRFIGIDAMPEHVTAARAFAARLGIDNATFHIAEFSAALERDDLAADYITAQGVLSWVGPAVREQLFALAARNLRPGGVASIGYNAQPGWLGMLSFQRLVRQIGLSAQGAAHERFETAVERLRALSPLGLGAVGDEQLAMIDKHRAALPDKYFVHEYMHDGWEPQWSSTVLGMAARNGLAFVGSARADRLREDFILRAAQRAALDGIADPVLHELLVDHFTGCSFRCDIYTKGEPVPLGEAEAEGARLSRLWMRRPGSEGLPFELQTPAGTIRFDNPSARLLWNALEKGPASVSEVAATGGEVETADLLDVLDALAIQHLVPVELMKPDSRLVGCATTLRDTKGAAMINAELTPWGPVRNG